MEPKYKIGDKVWKILGGKAIEVTVYGVALSRDYNQKEKFVYNAAETNSISTSSIYCFDTEETLFTSRETLINSL